MYPYDTIIPRWGSAAACTCAMLTSGNLLYPRRDEADSKNALLEVRSGSGGDEAAAFAKELFEMYRRFAEVKGWQFEDLHCSRVEAGESREGCSATLIYT